MRKSRYYARLLAAFVSRFRIAIALSIVFGVGIFLIFTFIIPRFTGGKSTRIGLTGRYHTDELPVAILNLMGEGLTQIDTEGKAAPALATSWESSDNAKTWTFHLASGKKWSDGTAVTASTIHYEFSDLQIEAPDDHTLIFKLASEFVPFPTVVAKPTFKQGLVGSGKWRATKVQLNGNIVQRLSLANSSGDTISIKFYPSEEMTKLAFKLGEVDEIDGVINPTPLDNWDTVASKVSQNKNRYVAIFYNTEDSTLQSKNLRQALSYAIDKNSLSDFRVISPISPSSWAYNPQVKPYDYDKKKAKDLVDEIKKETKSDVSIKLVTYPALLELADKIAKYWEEIGVNTSILVSSIEPSNYQAFLAIYDIPPDPDQYYTWHSTQLDTNISNYKNPRIDKLLEDGRVEQNHEARKKIYLDFQRFLLEDAPATFLFHPSYYTLVRK